MFLCDLTSQTYRRLSQVSHGKGAQSTILKRNKECEVKDTQTCSCLGETVTAADSVATWGGLIIMGNAPTNKGTQEVEGIEGHYYGGSDPLDSSGSLRYVRVWHGGSVIGQDNEINGITFAGVGSGTTCENIEVALKLAVL